MVQLEKSLQAINNANPLDWLLKTINLKPKRKGLAPYSDENNAFHPRTNHTSWNVGKHKNLEFKGFRKRTEKVKKEKPNFIFKL